MVSLVNNYKYNYTNFPVMVDNAYWIVSFLISCLDVKILFEKDYFLNQPLNRKNCSN
ncbi:MAG: hypothetical protein LiPW30_785 [Parcubacteria group bacterium LiPW_30]|nr:MAG: hypothetical protein LiPW30_785 [Parcubacteria group bacterium LiPW_30]